MTLKSITITKTELKPVTTEIEVQSEKPEGLRFAVLYKCYRGGEFVIGLFDSLYWANRFITKATSLGGSVRVVNTSTGEDMTGRE